MKLRASLSGNPDGTYPEFIAVALNKEDCILLVQHRNGYMSQNGDRGWTKGTYDKWAELWYSIAEHAGVALDRGVSNEARVK
jgi:hypothetical protein